MERGNIISVDDADKADNDAVQKLNTEIITEEHLLSPILEKKIKQQIEQIISLANNSASTLEEQILQKEKIKLAMTSFHDLTADLSEKEIILAAFFAPIEALASSYPKALALIKECEDELSSMPEEDAHPNDEEVIDYQQLQRVLDNIIAAAKERNKVKLSEAFKILIIEFSSVMENTKKTPKVIESFEKLETFAREFPEAMMFINQTLAMSAVTQPNERVLESRNRESSDDGAAPERNLQAGIVIGTVEKSRSAKITEIGALKPSIFVKRFIDGPVAQEDKNFCDSWTSNDIALITSRIDMNADESGESANISKMIEFLFEKSDNAIKIEQEKAMQEAAIQQVEEESALWQATLKLSLEEAQQVVAAPKRPTVIIPPEENIGEESEEESAEVLLERRKRKGKDKVVEASSVVDQDINSAVLRTTQWRMPNQPRALDEHRKSSVANLQQFRLPEEVEDPAYLNRLNLNGLGFKRP